MMGIRIEGGMGEVSCLREEAMHRIMAEECLLNAIRFRKRRNDVLAALHAHLAMRHLEAADLISFGCKVGSGFDSLDAKRKQAEEKYFFAGRLEDGCDFDRDDPVCPVCGAPLKSAVKDKKK
jgi:hypothetical protein